MRPYQENLVGSASGVLRALAGVSVTVTDDATDLPASLYSDNGVTPLPQPLETDNAGFFVFYAADGNYTLSFSSPIITGFTRKITLEDPTDDPYATKTELAAVSGAELIGYRRGFDDVVMTVAQALDEATVENASVVRGTVLDGLSLATSATITADDSVLSAFGKIQKQVTDHIAAPAVPAPASISRSARTANIMLAAGDRGKLIDITAGTFTQTFAAAATLGDGWCCYLRNSGTGDITLDPNGAELIDGVTSGVVKPGMTLLIQCDASAFNVVRIDTNPITEIKTSGTGGTWPLGVRRAKLRMTGGGASGCYTGSGTAFTTGAAAGYLEKTFAVQPGTTYTYSVGANGVVATTGQNLGNPGGNSTFTYTGVACTANGGVNTATYASNPGATATGGDINIKGGTGTLGAAANQALGGSTPLGLGGGDSQQGTGYGSGGGGSGTNTGAGAPGVVILEY